MLMQCLSYTCTTTRAPFRMSTRQRPSVPDIEVLELEEEEIELDLCFNLVVFNDEVNTFDHVINTLIEICDHTPEQAEQCTLIIHYKGKCTVRTGEWDEMASMRNAICQRGISAEVL